MLPNQAEKNQAPACCQFNIDNGIGITRAPKNQHRAVDAVTKNASAVFSFDMLGKQEKHQRGAPKQTYRFGENVVSGMYVIEVRQAGQTATIKVVKQ